MLSFCPYSRGQIGTSVALQPPPTQRAASIAPGIEPEDRFEGTDSMRS